MLECPRCGGPIPRVHGATRQACPHCGLETDAAGRPMAPAATATPAPRAPRASSARRASRLLSANLGRLLAAWAPVWGLWFVASVLIEAYAESRGLRGADGGGDVLALINYLALSVPLVLPVMTVALAVFGAAAVELSETGRLDLGALKRRLRAQGGRTLAAAFVLTVLVSAGVLTVILPFLFLYWYLYAVPFAAAGAPTLAAAFNRSRAHVRSGAGRSPALWAVAVFLVGSVASYVVSVSAVSFLPRQLLVSVLDVAPWVVLTGLAAAGFPRRAKAADTAAEMTIVRRG